MQKLHTETPEDEDKAAQMIIDSANALNERPESEATKSSNLEVEQTEINTLLPNSEPRDEESEKEMGVDPKDELSNEEIEAETAKNGLAPMCKSILEDILSKVRI